MTFEEAVMLAREILEAGYRVEILSCREDGRLVGWRIYFLGPPSRSSVQMVASPQEWTAWQQRIQDTPWHRHPQEETP